MSNGPVADADGDRRDRRMLPLAIAVVLGIAGSRLVMIDGRTALIGGILLLVGSLLAGAIALGGVAYGPRVEDPPDLSSRLALGLLGGVLAGLVHGMLTVASGWFGLTELMSAGIDVELSAMDWWGRVAVGAIWGIGLGVFYRALPGASFLGKGAVFGLLLSAWQLLYVYPFELGLGMLGADAGWGVLPLVVVGNVICGAIAAWPVAWGGRFRGESLSAPLVT